MQNDMYGSGSVEYTLERNKHRSHSDPAAKHNMLFRTGQRVVMPTWRHTSVVYLDTWFQRPHLANVGFHHCRGPHRIAGPIAPMPHDPPLTVTALCKHHERTGCMGVRGGHLGIYRSAILSEWFSHLQAQHNYRLPIAESKLSSNIPFTSIDPVDVFLKCIDALLCLCHAECRSISGCLPKTTIHCITLRLCAFAFSNSSLYPVSLTRFQPLAIIIVYLSLHQSPSFSLWYLVNPRLQPINTYMFPRFPAVSQLSYLVHLPPRPHPNAFNIFNVQIQPVCRLCL